jgi:hypothetical protein
VLIAKDDAMRVRYADEAVADLRSKLENFIEYFNRVFAKPFRWTYTGRPLRAKPAM